MSEARSNRKRARYETIYRISWAAHYKDFSSAKDADDRVALLERAGIVAIVDKFKRPK